MSTSTKFESIDPTALANVTGGSARDPYQPRRQSNGPTQYRSNGCSIGQWGGAQGRAGQWGGAHGGAGPRGAHDGLGQRGGVDHGNDDRGY